MKIRLLAASVATTVTLMGSLIVAPPATAAAPGPESSLTTAQTAELDALLIASDPATKTFDADAAITNGATDQAVADFAAIVEASGWSIGGAVFTGPSEAVPRLSTAVAECTGWRGYIGFYDWWGWEWGLNSCDTDLLIEALPAGGGSIAAVGALLTSLGPAPADGITAAVGALMDVGADPIKVCKTASRGAHAIYINVFDIGGTGCWGQ